MKRFALRLWPIIFLAAVPFLPLWRAVFFGAAIGPFDQIRQFAPWNGPIPSRAWDILQADGVLQFYPWRALVFSAWGKHQLPLWNPYALAGTPLLANSQSGGFYPLHILLGLLNFPTALAMVMLAWFHLAWAGIGTYRLVRSLDGTRLGGTVAGASFALSPFMLGWTGLPSVITTVAWIPWVLFFVASSFRRKPAPVGLAISVAMMVLAGHLQFAAYGLMAGGLFAIGLSYGGGKRTLPAWASCVGGVLLGAMLAAPQLLPVLDYSKFSHRQGAATEEGYQAYAGSAIQPYELGTLPFAPLAGQPFEPANVEGFGSSSGSGPSGYFPQYIRPGDNYAESAVSLGLLILTLVFLAPWRRRPRDLVPPAVVGLVGILLATAKPLTRMMYFGIPGWSASGSPGRAVCLFVLTGCVIAGLAVGALPKLPEKGSARFVPLLLPFVLAAVGAGALNQWPEPKVASVQVVAQIASAATRSALPWLLAAVIFTVVCVTAAYHLDRRVNKALILAAPVAFALLAGALQIIPTGDPSFLTSSPLKLTDPYARIAVVNHSWGLIWAAPATMPPNTPAAAGIHDLSGYDSLLHRDSVALLRAIDGEDPAPPVNGNIMFVKPNASPAALADAGVTEVWSRDEMANLGEASAADSGVYRYRIPGPGRASTPAGPAAIEGETPSRLTVRAQGPGRLVVRDRNMPGWMAKVDGRHVPLLGTMWREVELAPGLHEVEFDYVPPGLMNGVAMAAAAVLLLGVIAALTRRPRKPDQSAENAA